MHGPFRRRITSHVSQACDISEAKNTSNYGTRSSNSSYRVSLCLNKCLLRTLLDLNKGLLDYEKKKRSLDHEKFVCVEREFEISVAKNALSFGTSGSNKTYRHSLCLNECLLWTLLELKGLLHA